MFDLDLEHCPNCGGELKIITAILEQLVIEKILSHPIPDLTGYITQGQLVLSRELHLHGVFPPIDVLPSLSRLMNAGIGAGRTVAEHRRWADQL